MHEDMIVSITNINPLRMHGCGLQPSLSIWRIPVDREANVIAPPSSENELRIARNVPEMPSPIYRPCKFTIMPVEFVPLKCPLLLISLRFEQREYLREGVVRAFISPSPRKPTGCKLHVSGLNCRCFVRRSATDRSFTHARKKISRAFEVKWNQQCHTHQHNNVF